MKIECNIKTKNPCYASEIMLNDLLSDFENWLSEVFPLCIDSYTITISDGDNSIVASEYLRGCKTENKGVE